MSGMDRIYLCFTFPVSPLTHDHTVTDVYAHMTILPSGSINSLFCVIVE